MDAILNLLIGGNSVFFALFGGLVAVVVAWMRGRVTGARAERDRRAAERLKSISEAQKIDEAIAGRDPDKNREELGKWSR